jgi:hypothetical protein
MIAYKIKDTIAQFFKQKWTWVSQQVFFFVSPVALRHRNEILHLSDNPVDIFSSFLSFSSGNDLPDEDWHQRDAYQLRTSNKRTTTVSQQVCRLAVNLTVTKKQNK